MGAAAHLETRSLPVIPGSEVVATIRVRNTGAVVDQFALDVLGDAASWAAAEPPRLSLFPGAEEAARIVFRPPRSASVPAGPVPFGVRVHSQEDPGGSVVEEGVVEVAPFSDTFAELAPRTSRGSRGGTHDLAIDNRGNARLNATLTGGDPDKLLRIDVRPPAIVADPGTAAFAKVDVRARQRFWRGQPKTRPFHLQLDAPGAPPVGVDGTLLQEPILPSWLLRAVTALLAVLVLAVLAWLFFLQPAIQSTARQQADQAVVARLGPAPAGAAGGGGGASPAGAGGGGGASPSASGAGSSAGAATPPVPALPGNAQPIDGRIKAGEAAPAVAAGTTLFITDLVFSNPSETATGELRVVRSGTPLIVLRLENFRDLDYHFVTPIVITATQELRLECAAGCDAETAVFYSGFTR